MKSKEIVLLKERLLPKEHVKAAVSLFEFFKVLLRDLLSSVTKFSHHISNDNNYQYVNDNYYYLQSEKMLP